MAGAPHDSNRAYRKSRQGFPRRLVLGAVAVSILGLAGASVAVGALARGGAHDPRGLAATAIALAVVAAAAPVIAALRAAKGAGENARGAEQGLEAMLDSLPLACSVLDENFNVLEVNQEMLKLLGLADKQEFIGRFFDFSPKYQPDGQLSQEKMAEKVRLSIRTGRAHFEWMHQTPDGKSIPCEVTVVRMAVGGRDMLIGYARDLREINAAAFMVKQLEKLAFTDTLTGARNRRFFAETAERELHSCADEGRDFALILIDIDRFKLVNDTHGHGIGDEVLKIVVRRTRHTLKHDTLVARYGGEEFMVMLPGVSHENAMKIAWQIQRKIEETPFIAEDLEIRVTVSIGVASRTEERAALQDIVRDADKALYHAKNTGRNRAVSCRDVPPARG